MEVLAPSPPNVRLHISIKDKKKKEYTEIIRSNSKGYETVEVDGLVFRRKRRQAAADLQSQCKKRKMQQEEIGEEGRVLQEDVQEVKGAATNPPKSSPFDDSVATVSTDVPVLEGGRNVEKNSELLAPSSISDKTAIAQILLQNIPQEQVEAERLLRLIDQICQVLTGKDSMPMLAHLKASIAESLQAGSLICHEEPEADDQQDKLEQVQQKRLLTLQKQADLLQQEKSEWHAVLQETESLAVALPACRTQAAIRGELEAHVDPVLEGLQRQSYLTVSFQVEGLAKMLSSVELLLNKAENQCRLMQVEYHKEKFFKIPHIESPARLIHEIVKERRV